MVGVQFGLKSSGEEQAAERYHLFCMSYAVTRQGTVLPTAVWYVLSSSCDGAANRHNQYRKSSLLPQAHRYEQ